MKDPMNVTVDQYLKDVRDSGTGPAKILAFEEVMMSQTLARNIYRRPGITPEELADQIFCLLFSHRGMVLANWLMERAEGKPMAVDGPIPTPAPLPPPEDPPPGRNAA